MKKNRVFILLAAFTVLSALAFTACDALSSLLGETTPLTAPTPTIEEATFMLNWDLVPNAASYTVDINDGSTSKTVPVTGTAYSLESLTTEHKVYTIKVKAVAASGDTTYGDSPYSAGISCEPAYYIFNYDGKTPATAAGTLNMARASDSEVTITELTDYGKTLVNVVIPQRIAGINKTVTAIGPNAFGNASMMAAVVIPDTIVTIDEGAFRGCTSLVTISFKADAVQAAAITFGTDVFSGCNAINTIDVPAGSGNAYKDKLEDIIPQHVADSLDSIVQETKAVTGVTLSPATLELEVGGSKALSFTIIPSDATNLSVTWTTSDTNIAVVDRGFVTAKAAGSAVITITTMDGSFSKTCIVTVKAATTEPEEGKDLNGIWVSEYGEEMKLDNGNMEMSMDGTPMIKGTYTLSNDKITAGVTSVHGGYLTESSEGHFTLESKWYSENELKTALKKSGMTDAEFEESFGSMFYEMPSASYSVRGNTLTITNDDGSVTTLTRKTATGNTGQNYTITVTIEPAEKQFVTYNAASNTLSLENGYTLYAWYINNEKQSGGLTIGAITEYDNVQVIATDRNGIPYSNELTINYYGQMKQKE